MFWRRFACLLHCHHWGRAVMIRDARHGRPIFKARQCLVCGRVDQQLIPKGDKHGRRHQPRPVKSVDH